MHKKVEENSISLVKNLAASWRNVHVVRFRARLFDRVVHANLLLGIVVPHTLLGDLFHLPVGRAELRRSRRQLLARRRLLLAVRLLLTLASMAGLRSFARLGAPVTASKAKLRN